MPVHWQGLCRIQRPVQAFSQEGIAMKPNKSRLATIVLCSVFAFPLAIAGAEEPTRHLAWNVGPTEAKLGDQAVLKVPEGYRFLNAQDTQSVLKQMGNFPSGAELGLVTSASADEQWFVVIRYQNEGYVRDDDADNWKADEMLAAIKEGTEAANEKRKGMGIPPLIVKGWEEKPHYDKASNKVVWAVSAESEGHLTVNYHTLALGRHGYMNMNMVGSLNDLAGLKPHTQVLLSNLNFVPGKTYADFNGATDKVAAVGLSALIAGAAFKSGLLAKLWAVIVPILLAAKKLVLLLVIGVGMLVKKYWNKKAEAASHA
jgi:uncharacterized membrane-anchored protein